MAHEFWPAAGRVRRFALHTVLLFAAMAAPYVLLAPRTASLAAVGIGLAYPLFRAIDFYLHERGRPKPPLKVRILFNTYCVSVPIAIAGVMWVLIVEWVLWAYRPFTSAGGIWDRGMIALVAITASFIAPPILFLLIAPRLARKNGGPPSRFLDGVRARGLGSFQVYWLSNTFACVQAFALLSVYVSTEVLVLGQVVRYGDSVVTSWDLITTYPVLPLALLTVAVIQPLEVFLSPDRDPYRAVVQAYIDGTEDMPGPDPRAQVACGGLTAAACTASMIAVIYPMHLGVTITTLRDGATALKGVVEVWKILANTHEDDDWTTTEFAEAINRFAYWTPDSPEEGLGSLVADPGQVFPETCTVRATAGIVEAPAAGHVEPDVKFCVAVACAPPYSWSATPALFLFSSRESDARGWRENWYADIYAEGRAAASGGYCTSEGGLADSYQG